MSRKSSKKSSSKKSSSAANATASAVLRLPLRAGLPAKDSIIGVRDLVRRPAAGDVAAAEPTRFRIIQTNELDEYEAAASGAAAVARDAAVAAAPTGDNFKGTSRKAAKLSLGRGRVEQFDDVKDLIESLPDEQDMILHDPRIKTTSTSARVTEEQRNVRVSAFIYAASREDDNDFHLIIGRDPDSTPEMYMTMELSGLPPSSSASFRKLKAARDAYKEFFEEDLPGLRYDFYDPPIPVEITGSLFFDITHATGSRPGPKSLKSRMPTIWEVHPISKMVFEP